MSVETFTRLLNEDLDLEMQVELLKTLPALDIQSVELAQCAKAVLDQAIKVPLDNDNIVDLVGTGGDKSNSFNISTTASFVVAGAGVKIAKHGNRAITSKSGGFDLLQALNIDIAETPEKAQKQMQQFGMTFLFAPFFHPSYKRIAAARAELAKTGQKTLFNFLGPLVNPAFVKRAAIGVFDLGLMQPFIEALKFLGFKKAIVIHGNGMDELSLTGTDKVAILEDGKIFYRSLTADDLGLLNATPDDLRGGDANENAQITLDILSGKEKGAKRDVVLLNGAAGIMVGTDLSLEAALIKARESLDSGAAFEKLKSLQKK